VVNEKVLVEYWWNSKNKYGFTPIIAFPQLPCGITGLDITLSIYGNGIEDNIARIGIKEQQKVDFDIPAKTKVLCIATEWLSRNGGLSTFNRFLCRTLSSENCEVVCVVLDSDITEKQSAIDDGVILIDAQKGPAASNINPLQSRLDLPKGFIPDIIIGHDRITGESMLDQKRSFFESAKTILFIHTAPEEIELLKDSHEGIELMKRAEQRRQLQKDIALKSDLVAAVGPHLYTEIYMQLGATEGARKVIRFDPGLMSSDPVATDIKLPTPLCQIFGRMEDDALKGVDIAIKVMDKVYSKATTPVKPVLIIRGLVEGTGDSFMRKKNQLSTSGLPIRYRVYDPSIETLTDDLRASSLILMPSRAEGFGLTGLEAISAGCPALLSDRSGLAELILEFAPEEAHHWIVSVAGDETTFLGKWETQVEFILSDRKAARERLKTLRDKLSEKISWTASVKAMMDALNEKQNLTLSPSLASRECELS
jgi:glycosyltransferase involved in cell wall biosynthesis